MVLFENDWSLYQKVTNVWPKYLIEIEKQQQTFWDVTGTMGEILCIYIQIIHFECPLQCLPYLEKAIILTNHLSQGKIKGPTLLILKVT